MALAYLTRVPFIIHNSNFLIRRNAACLPLSMANLHCKISIHNSASAPRRLAPHPTPSFSPQPSTCFEHTFDVTSVRGLIVFPYKKKAEPNQLGLTLKICMPFVCLAALRFHKSFIPLFLKLLKRPTINLLKFLDVLLIILFVFQYLVRF